MSHPSVQPVSADSHVNAPAEMWGEYLPREFRDGAPRVERSEDGDFVLFEGERRPMSLLLNAAGHRPEEYKATVRRFDEVRPGGWLPQPRVEDQEIDGIGAEVLFGAVGAPLRSRDPALTRASYTAYNHWLADFCSYAPERLIGVAYIPCDHPDDAIAEIHDAASRGLRGASLPYAPGRSTWASDEWTPLWHTLVDLGWPAHFHIGAGAVQFALAHRDDSGDAFLNAQVASKLQMPLSLGPIVFGGVLARHPDLKIVSVEAQIGWIPFWKEYIDHAYEKHRWHTHVLLDEQPSFYVERQVWYTFMEDGHGVESRHACGVDRIMWSSDYPHSETTWPHSQKIIGEIFERVPVNEVKRIVRDNCIELYRLR